MFCCVFGDSSDMNTTQKIHEITLIPGDGIGPEVIESTRRLIDATGVKVNWDVVHAGASQFKKGIPSGVPQETIESIRRTRLVLKGPLETPVGFGEKSANVTLRKLFETYGNIRPVREWVGVPTPYSGRKLDLTVVRENVEDLYAGIEHMQTPEVAQCLKLISKKGCEKIVRLAFEVARAEGRKSVHCATKSNIMKMTEGLLKRTFEEIAPEYPDIAAHHIIIDNCAHQLVKKPEQFEVIVTTNMNGDIMSDLTSALVGGLGFAPSANIGSECAIFEAVHGSAPKYAGKDVINPTAMIMSGVMLLRHIGETDAAQTIEDALSVTWAEAKARTRDVVGDVNAVGTRAFTEAVMNNFGKKPKDAIRVSKPIKLPVFKTDMGKIAVKQREVVGLDVFVETDDSSEVLGTKLNHALTGTPVKLKMISNRGTQVFPATGGSTDTVNQFRCRLMALTAAQDITLSDLNLVLERVEGVARWMHIEKLQSFDAKPAYTKAQGED